MSLNKLDTYLIDILKYIELDISKWLDIARNVELSPNEIMWISKKIESMFFPRYF